MLDEYLDPYQQEKLVHPPLEWFEYQVPILLNPSNVGHNELKAMIRDTWWCIW